MKNSNGNILEVKKLSKTYSGIKVLHDVDFQLAKGEVHALVGENGAGKSTLIKSLSGVVAPDNKSKIYWNGKLIRKMTPRKAIALGLSVIYQDLSMFPNLSVAENICMGMDKAFIVDYRAIRDKAKKTLDFMGIDIDLDCKLGDISIGKQQLIAIARAITFKAKVIIMDEPTAALSSSEVNMLYRIIESLKAKNVSIIYISHKLEEVFRVADRISVLRDGHLIITDSADAFTNDSLIRYMVGRELRFIPMHNEEGESDEVLFEVKDIVNPPMVNGVSFKVRKNEVLGITGLVGAGRSEMAQTVFGLRKGTGRVFIHGKEVKISDANDAIAKGLCYLPEDRLSQGLFMDQNMIWNTTASTIESQLDGLFISEDKELNTTNEYIESVDIRPAIPQLSVRSLSGGNQQKILFARWMNAKPKVFIVDEPTVGVDVGAKAEIHKVLRDMAKSGVAVVLISSDLTEILAVSDRILVMREGIVVDEVSAENATQESILEKGLMG